MAALALVAIALWMLLAGATRGILHARAGGDAPLRFADRPGSAQWWARVLGIAGFVLLVATPLAELAGLPPLAALDHVATRFLGVVLTVCGIVGVVVGQATMGRSWRGDVDPESRTSLVMSGPFRWVRSPIFTASAAASLGIALMVPNVVGLAMLATNVLTYQVQTRLVEEPYLERAHGDAYRAYAARTGRFLPGIGRLRRP